MRIVNFLYLIPFLIGCATTHPGRLATSLNPQSSLDLKVSSNLVMQYSDEYNCYIDLTFENLRGNWIHVSEVDLDFSNGGDVAHNIIVGNDLYAWAESFEERRKITDHNAAMGIASMVLAGAVIHGVGRGSGNVKTANTGAAVILSGAAWDASRRLADSKNKAEISKSVPEKHIYRPFTIPAGGLIRRWFIVNVPGQYMVKTFIVKLKTVEGEVAQYKVPFRC